MLVLPIFITYFDYFGQQIFTDLAHYNYSDLSQYKYIVAYWHKNKKVNIALSKRIQLFKSFLGEVS